MQGTPAFASSLPLPYSTSVVAKCITCAPRRPSPLRRTPFVRRAAIFVVASDASVTASPAHATEDIAAHRSDPLVKTSADDAVDHITNGSDDTEASTISCLEDVTELINAIEETSILDFHLEHNGVTVQFSRPGGLGFDSDGNVNPPPDPVYVSQPNIADQKATPRQMAPLDTSNRPSAPISTPPVEPPESPKATESATQDAVENDPNQIYETDFVVTSNRVGFFFCGAKNKPPLVNIGDSVEFNQPVCIIEQLGQQYVYLSEASGKVVRVFVEDGDVVEYGTQIMVIRPD